MELTVNTIGYQVYEFLEGLKQSENYQDEEKLRFIDDYIAQLKEAESKAPTDVPKRVHTRKLNLGKNGECAVLQWDLDKLEELTKAKVELETLYLDKLDARFIEEGYHPRTYDAAELAVSLENDEPIYVLYDEFSEMRFAVGEGEKQVLARYKELMKNDVVRNSMNAGFGLLLLESGIDYDPKYADIDGYLVPKEIHLQAMSECHQLLYKAMLHLYSLQFKPNKGEMKWN